MRLLVIDDEEDICDMIAEIATDRGFEVLTTSQPETVEAKLGTFKPDVIMLDLMMPGTDGVELLRVMVDHVKDVKICLMSGSDARVLNSARRLGSAHGLNVVAALEKPLEIVKLRETFDQMMGKGKTVMGSDLAHAIALGQFTLYYQPIIDLKTREVKGVESLARWAHPTRGILPPAEFIEQVTSEGLMQPLTDNLLAAAVAQAAKWHQAGETLSVSVNVTAASLLELTMPDKVSELCNEHHLPCDRIILEVTETEAMHDVPRTMDVLLRMRIRSIGVSIDNFGTGQSSLRELQRMPFSEMKIDRSFVLDMANSNDCAVVVNSIIDLGHNLGLKLIATGVEDRRVWQMLSDKGCDYVQGFYMAKPMPPAEFDRWLKSWRETATTGGV